MQQTPSLASNKVNVCVEDRVANHLHHFLSVLSRQFLPGPLIIIIHHHTVHPVQTAHG